MLVDSTLYDFLHYLRCDLPLGYPLKTPITRLLATNLTISSRRELLHQQAQFLDTAKQFLKTQPWISYLAAIKHEAVLVTIPTYASQLIDIVDQFFFSELQQKSKELLKASRAAIDDATAQSCERLILLQSEAAQIEDATKSISAAVQAGFTAVEPLPPPPPEPSSGHGSLPYFVAGGVGCVVIGAIIPPYYGGMAWSLAGLIVTGVSGARAYKKEKAIVDAEGTRFKAYLVQENYHILCRKSVILVLALPFETRASALANLPPCLAALKALAPERETLEAKYIGPIILKRG
jgi:hypothetical protein